MPLLVRRSRGACVERGEALEEDDRRVGPDGLSYWTQVIDGAPYGCWYRLRDDGHIEVLTRGHRVVLPVEAIALLPESGARSVLAKIAEVQAGSRLPPPAEGATEVPSRIEPTTALPSASVN